MRWLLRQCNTELEAFLPSLLRQCSAASVLCCRGLKRQAAVDCIMFFYGPPQMELDWAYHPLNLQIRPGKKKLCS